MQPRRPFQKKEEGLLRCNTEIKADQVRLIDENGENVGVVTLSHALSKAQMAGLDLLEINPSDDTPVCKIMDYGKWKYERQKKQSEVKKNQKVVKVKEIKLRPVTEQDAYNTKLKQAQKFLEKGDKVKLTIRFKGREMAHRQQGFEQLQRFKDDLGETFKVEKEPSMEGRQLSLTIAPNS